ncbi:hypothetical protein GCM10027418_08010 [Mariniluteicoccus endophyticus]
MTNSGGWHSGGYGQGGYGQGGYGQGGYGQGGAGQGGWGAQGSSGGGWPQQPAPGGSGQGGWGQQPQQGWPNQGQQQAWGQQGAQGWQPSGGGSGWPPAGSGSGNGPGGGGLGSEPPRKSAAGPALIIGVGVLVLVLVGVLAYSLLNPKEDGPVAPPPTTTTQPTPSPTASPKPSASPTPSGDGGSSCPTRAVAAKSPGWQSLGSVKDSAAIDLPPDWKQNNGVIWGFEGDNNEIVLAHCAGVYLQGTCGKQFTDRGRVGFITIGSKSNPNDNVDEAIRRWGRLAQFDTKTKTQHPVPEPTRRTVQINGGAAEADVANVTFDVAVPDEDCPAPRYSITIATAPMSANQKAMLVITRHIGIDQEMPASMEDQIIGSWRPL